MNRISHSLLMYSFIFCLLTLFMFGCKKIDQVKSLSVDNFVNKTKSLIEQKGYKGLVSLIDFSTTKSIPSPKGSIFATKLFLNGHYASRLISIIREDMKVLHYFIIVDKVNESETNNIIYSLSGRKVGAYKVVNGKVQVSASNLIVKKASSEDVPVDFIEEEMPNPDQIEEEIIDVDSWWSCTRECISDSHIACYMDTECAVLLIVTNLGAGAATPKGLGAGSLSLGLSCGIACAFNSHMDLLPQY